MRRLVYIVAGAVVAVLLLVLVVAPALSQEDTKNQVEDWCETGVKYEPVDTPYIVPEPPAGTTWTLLVLKGGTTNETIAFPVVGQGYSHSEHDNSHVILCYEEEVNPSTTTTTSTSSTTTSVPASTTTTTEPPATTTTESPTSTSTTSPVSSTTTTTTELSSTTTLPPGVTTVPPPTLIESGDAGYIDEVDHDHEDVSMAELAIGGLFGILLGGLALVAYYAWRDRQE